MPDKERRPTVLLVDNSIAVTGALKCAVNQALLMAPNFRYVVVLPENSEAKAYVEVYGLAVYTLPLLELQRSAQPLFQYPFRLLANSRKLIAIVQKENAAALVMNDYYNLLGVCLKMRMPALRLVTFVRFLPATMPVLLHKFWAVATFQYSDSVVAVSQAVRRQLPVTAKLELLYDVILYPERYLPYDVRPCVEKVELLYLGNYIQGKGHEHALRAFKMAYQKDQRLRLTFMGGTMGINKNKSYKACLERYAAEQDLAAVVRFLPFEPNVEVAYKAADIFLNFSESESFSMTCAEAAFYGVPTIASRCGGPEEIIVDGETGMLLPNKDVAAFAEAILKLAGDVDLRRKFSEKCKSYVRSKFNKQDFVNKMERVLQLPKVFTQVNVPN